jgi:hypothetical protein
MIGLYSIYIMSTENEPNYYEKFRNKNLEELTNDEQKLLSYYLMQQVQMDDLTSKDKEFLNTPMEDTCTYCDKTYSIAPAISNGQCHACMSSQGLRYEENMLTPGSNFIGKVFFYGFAALIIWGWLSL